MVATITTRHPRDTEITWRVLHEREASTGYEYQDIELETVRVGGVARDADEWYSLLQDGEFARLYDEAIGQVDWMQLGDDGAP